MGNGETVIEMNETGELDELIAEYKVCEGLSAPPDHLILLFSCRVTAAWQSVRYVVDKVLCRVCGVVGARRVSRMPSTTSNVLSVTRMGCSCAQTVPPDTNSITCTHLTSLEIIFFNLINSTVVF